MSKKQVLRQDHIIPRSGPFLEVRADSQTVVMNANNGLLRLDNSEFLAPSVSEVFLKQFVGKPLHMLFKELRTRTYLKETQFLTKLLLDRKALYGQNDSKWLVQWRKIYLSMCTQCALENCGYHPFLEQEAKQWLQDKFQSQSVGAYFNDRWEALKDEYNKRTGWPGPFYYRNGNRISFAWAEFVG